MKITLFWRKFIAICLSIVALSLGWLGSTGLLLLVAFVPLLWISAVAEDSRRGWWSTFGWALICFVGWNLSTVWWINNAAPIVGPFAATLASSFYSMLAFMIFHTVSKRAPKALAYTVLVSLWIAFEYNYTVSEFSWPWLLLGNGFSNDIWAIQWYEFTGIFGGSLWVWCSNLLIFEAWQRRRGYVKTAVVVFAPLVLSVVIYAIYDEGDGELVEVSVVQPNVGCYDAIKSDDLAQENNLVELLGEVPASSRIVVMPEGALPRNYWESHIGRAPIIQRLSSLLGDRALVSGASTLIGYEAGMQSATARRSRFDSSYYDFFNTAILIDSTGYRDRHHKGRLVIGVENTPTWVFEIFDFFVVELDEIGQMGIGSTTEPFDIEGVGVGGAICYEGLYGDYYGGFVRGGADMMTIISNDGWWGDTPGYNHLYSFAQLRAVEHRRAIARSANTGISGFITARGDSVVSMEWEERGVLTREVRLNSKMTLYTLWGDYVARVAVLVAALSLLYYVSYRARKRHHLV